MITKRLKKFTPRSPKRLPIRRLRREPQLLFILFLLLFTGMAELPGATYPHAYVEETYDTWNNICSGTTNPINDVLFLRGGYPTCSDCAEAGVTCGFCQQSSGNPKVWSDAIGNSLIFVDGDNAMTTPNAYKQGDAIYNYDRTAGGKYHTDSCRCLADVAMAVPEVPRNCVWNDPIYPCDWTNYGWLGKGIAFVETPSQNICGFRFYAIVAVSDKGCGDHNYCDIYSESDDRYYLAWAVSKEGIIWRFLSNAGSWNCADWPDGPSWTDNPKDAKPIIWRTGFQADGKRKDTFRHQAGSYSDPALGGDGSFYLLFDYTPGIGEWPLSVRFHMDSAYVRGYSGMEFYEGPAPGTYTSFSGEIPTDLDVATHSFIPSVANPEDWRLMKKSDGTFSHLLLIYDAGTTFFTGRVAMRTTRNIKHPFTWSEERDFEECTAAENGYSGCTAAGMWFTGIAEPASYDSDGDPNAFYAYVTANTTNCGATLCNYTPGGLVPVKVNYSLTSDLGEVNNVRISKDASDPNLLHFTYHPNPRADHVILSRGNLDDLRSGGYSHRRSQCDCSVGTCEYSIGMATQDLYFLVIPVCSSMSEGSPGFSSFGMERPVPLGSCPLTH